MMKNILVVCFSIVLLQATLADDPCVIGNGNYLKTNKELDLHKFFGSYYTLYLLNDDFLSQYRCWTDNYFMSGIDTVHTTEAYNVSENKRVQFHGDVIYQGRAMYKEFPTWPELTANFSIIATCPQYQFAIFGGCPEATQGKPLVWIGFRNPDPTDAEVAAAEKIIEDNGLKFSDFGNGCENKAEYSFN